MCSLNVDGHHKVSKLPEDSFCQIGVCIPYTIS